MKFTIGIDYSLTSPSICISPGSTKLQDTRIHYLTDIKKYQGVFNKNITGHAHKPWSSPEQRYENIAFWCLNLFPKFDDIEGVFIEDYSMGSKGKVFHIAENTGCLKYQLYKLAIKFTCIPPTVIKKSFFGKGNADKNKMMEAFFANTKLDLYKVMGSTPTAKVGSPFSDIVDAYAILCHGLTLPKK